jgi:hypothetical protein
MPIKAVDCVDSMVSALVARVLVDPNQCASLAKRLNGVMIKPAKTLKIESNGDQENVARLLFFYMAICHDTRGLEGSLDGYIAGAVTTYITPSNVNGIKTQIHSPLAVWRTSHFKNFGPGFHPMGTQSTA